jgi:hypothetical protein
MGLAAAIMYWVLCYCESESMFARCAKQEAANIDDRGEL